MKSREEKIQKIVDFYFEQYSDEDLKEILKNGYRGFKDLSDEEIDEEYLDLE